MTTDSRPGDLDDAAELAAAQAEVLADRTAHAVERFLRAIPARYRAAEWEDLAGRTANLCRGKDRTSIDLREALFIWSGDPAGRNLILTGAPGTGKTHTAAALGLRHQWLNPGDLVAWWSVPSLIDALRREQGDKDNPGEPIWRQVREAEWLVLDDFAHARHTEFAAERMWQLADARFGADLRTIITTNAAWDELVAAWGAATMDRFRTGVFALEFAGESMRSPLW